MTYRPRRRLTAALLAAALSPCFFVSAQPAHAALDSTGTESAAADAAAMKDREPAIKELEATRDRLRALIGGMTDAQWTFRPAPDRWTTAEVVEHIILAEDLIRGLVEKNLSATQPAGAEAQKPLTDAEITALITDRSKKLKAPEVLQPVHRWATKADALAAFEESRARTIEFARTAKGDFRHMWAEHPKLHVPFDGVQWLVFMAGHSARHTMQIEEVIANPEYPK